MKNKFYNHDYVGFYESMYDFKPIQNKDLSQNKIYKTKTDYMQSIAYGVADFETQVMTEQSKQQLQEIKQQLTDGVEVDFDLINECQAEVVCGFFTLWNEEELGNVYLQRDIFNFIHTLMSLPYRLVYLDFHNLAFDGQFIISGLNQMGFECIHDDFDFENNKAIKNNVKVGKNVKECDMIDKCYKLSVRKGQWYELSIYWIDEIKIKNKVYRVQRQIRCYDSFKVITTSLENAVKSYTGIVTPDKKGWDYSKHYDRDIPFTERELSYIKFDSLAYLCLMYEVRDRQGITKKTASGYAFSQFKSQIFEELEKFFETGEITADYMTSSDCQNLYNYYKSTGNVKAFVNQVFNSVLMQDYPITVYKDLFQSYKGGYTAFNKWIYEQAIKDGKKYGITFDYNSLYPSVMSETEKLSQLIGSDVLYPFGSPLRGYGNYENNPHYQSGEYPCVIAKITIFDFKIKDNHVPTLRTSEYPVRVDTREYLSENVDKNGDKFTITTWKTDKEIADIKERYECKIIVKYYYLFKGTKDIFKSFINKHYMAKQTSKGVKRNVAKLILNSTYGKFGTNLMSTIDFPIIDNGKIKIEHIRDGFDSPVEDYSNENYNVAIASFITTYARLALFKVVDLLLEKGFSPVYQDTDSIHLLFKDMKELKEMVKLLTDLDVVDINNSGERMLLKCEGLFTDGKYLGAKKYVENINKNLLIKEVLECQTSEELEELIRQDQKLEYYCAGLSTKDLIKHYECFEICQNPKEIKQMWEQGKLYYEPLVNGTIVNPHLYYDKDLKYPVKGAFLRNVKKTVSGGVLIEHNIFIVTPKLTFSF